MHVYHQPCFHYFERVKVLLLCVWEFLVIPLRNYLDHNNLLILVQLSPYH